MKQVFRLGVMLCFSLLMAAQDDDHHQRHDDDAIGHSDKDLQRDQDGKLTRHRTEQDGAFAQVSINTGTGGSIAGASVSVSRGVTNDVASTTLNYSDFSEPADFSSFTFTNIFGTIPNSAFTGDNTKDLVLDVDTGQLDPTTTFSQRCTITFSPFSEVCGPAPSGVIHLEFRENGINRTRILDFKQEQVVGPVTTFIHQKADTGSADFQGAVFGLPVSTSQGTATVGVNHQSTLVITRQ